MTKKIRISDVTFYLIIAVIVISAALYTTRASEGFRVLGYSGFTVLTGSMQREIPQGSLVITKKTDPKDVKIGDDITFVRSDNRAVTHRVVTAFSNYEETGFYVFETKGLENPQPDSELVYEGNLIGVVVKTIPKLGAFLNYLAHNIGLVLFILGALLVATIALSAVFRKDGKQDARTAKEVTNNHVR